MPSSFKCQYCTDYKCYCHYLVQGILFGSIEASPKFNNNPKSIIPCELFPTSYLLLVFVADIVDCLIDRAVSIGELNATARHNALGSGEEGIEFHVLEASSIAAFVE